MSKRTGSGRRRYKDLSDFGKWIMQYIPENMNIQTFADCIGWSVGALDNWRYRDRHNTPRMNAIIDIITYLSQTEDIHPDELLWDMYNTQPAYKRAVARFESKQEKDK